MIKGQDFSTQQMMRWANSGHKPKQRKFLWGLVSRFWRLKQSQRTIQKRVASKRFRTGL